METILSKIERVKELIIQINNENKLLDEKMKRYKELTIVDKIVINPTNEPI